MTCILLTEHLYMSLASTHRCLKGAFSDSEPPATSKNGGQFSSTYPGSGHSKLRRVFQTSFSPATLSSSSHWGIPRHTFCQRILPSSHHGRYSTFNVVVFFLLLWCDTVVRSYWSILLSHGKSCCYWNSLPIEQQHILQVYFTSYGDKSQPGISYEKPLVFIRNIIFIKG